MNIFNALSARDDNKLLEVNLSALLAYFLNPAADHGVGNTFLGTFLDLVESEIKRTTENEKIKDVDFFTGVDFIKTEVKSECKIKKSGKQFFLDVLVDLHDKNGKQTHKIVVENKVRADAANQLQLKNYYEAVRKSIRGKQIIMVFLTPGGADSVNSVKLKEEFDALSDKDLGKNYKVWVHWNGENSVQSIIRENILNQEVKGKIPPINEHSRHTFKALAMHLEGYSLATRNSSSGIRQSADKYPIDEICSIDELGYEIVITNNRYYAYVRTLSSKEKVANTRKTLKEINKKLGLSVNEYSKTRDGMPRELTSHELGLAVAAALKRRERYA